MLSFVVGRWWTVLVPAVALGVLYSGLKGGWWGHGVGDGWPVAMALVLGAGLFAAVVGVAARAYVRPRTERVAPD